jgi:uncharacterized protein (DUF305 family)
MKLTKCIPVVLLILLIASACKEDDNGLKVQAHNDNEMMSIMHTMNTQMEAMPMTGDADHDFASMMIIHHQGAIDMANTELGKGKDATIKEMAQRIIDKQTVEKAELATWLQTHTPVSDAEGQAFDSEMMEVMKKMKNWKDIQVLTGNTDHDFSELMIVHHQTAADNAGSILHHGHHDNIKEMAKMMITDQNKEITDFSAWLITNKGY